MCRRLLPQPAKSHFRICWGTAIEGLIVEAVEDQRRAFPGLAFAIN
jgi:hypothetical protein